MQTKRVKTIRMDQMNEAYERMLKILVVAVILTALPGANGAQQTLNSLIPVASEGVFRTDGPTAARIVRDAIDKVRAAPNYGWRRE